MSPKNTIIINSIMILFALPVLGIIVPALVSAANTFLVVAGFILAGVAFIALVACVSEIITGVGKLNGEETNKTIESNESTEV